MTHVFQPLPDAPQACELCQHAGGQLLWQQGDWRVIRVNDEAFPAFYRVIYKRHVAEFSQLPGPERQRCMQLVAVVEKVLLSQLRPTKVNLAAFGNMVPHLHWHVVARFDWDSHFPQPIWGAKQREVTPPAVARLAMPLGTLDEAVVAALDGAARSA
ncbi:HIT family protein [Piscinibacter gummiphilus]|uniref:HIT family protein n=1 Tax=Piscinibacter gummiphilus TaxID=946333 RepID=A0ABZ0CQQ4_9BURK|nr:HIT family protein [Piscinibacter gummiphilus]WOB07325.1 HIT family protein [Piscinibacter gummiphilus]